MKKLLEWFSKFVRGLGRIILILTGLAFILLLIFYADKLLQYDVQSRGIELTEDGAEQVKLINEYRKTAIQLIGGIVIAIGLYLTWRRIRAMEKTVFVTEEGQITDRFSKAVEQLGNKESLAVRLGGIYALERIAKDSKDDHWTVMEVLSAFVRNYQPDRKEQVQEDISLQENSNNSINRRLSTDIQAILTVIGRRTISFDPDKNRINLSRAQLDGATLSGAQLKGATLSGTQLKGADLSKAQLDGANLSKAQLDGATLSGAQLKGATLSGTQLKGADLSIAQLDGANLSEAQLDGANLYRIQLNEANLSGAQLKGADLSTAQLRRANLIGMQLDGGYLSGAQLDGAYLSGAQLDEANLSGAYLNGANLTGAYLNGADLSKAKLKGADLSIAQLNGANLSKAQLKGAKLLGTQLKGVDLSKAQLDRAVDLTVKQLKSAKTFEEAKIDKHLREALEKKAKSEEE